MVSTLVGIGQSYWPSQVKALSVWLILELQERLLLAWHISAAQRTQQLLHVSLKRTQLLECLSFQELVEILCHLFSACAGNARGRQSSCQACHTIIPDFLQHELGLEFIYQYMMLFKWHMPIILGIFLFGRLAMHKGDWETLSRRAAWLPQSDSYPESRPTLLLALISSSSQEMHYPFSWLMCQQFSFSLFSCLLWIVCTLCGFCPAYYSLEKAEQQFSTDLLTKPMYIACALLLGKYDTDCP